MKLDFPMVMSFSSLLSFRPSGRIAPELAPRGGYRWLRGAVLFSVVLALTTAAGHAVTQPTTRKATGKTRKSAHHYAASTNHYAGSATHYAALPPGFRLRMSKWNMVFPGSHELLVQQNQELDRSQMFRVTDEVNLIQHEIAQDLVPVNETEALKLASDLSDSRRYCRPWTRDFLQDFSQAFYEQFHAPLQVNSLVRTMEQQHRLRRYNRFAAPEWGDTASTHLAGVSFDLSRRSLTGEQYAWITSYLLPLKEAGMVDPIEERQPVLHVMVFEKYGDRSSGASSWSEANEPTEMSNIGIGGSQP